MLLRRCVSPAVSFPVDADLCPLSSASLPDVARAIELLEKLQESGDVPGHKLQSLKKVLQSEFCTAIREVGAAAGRVALPLRPAFIVTDLYCNPPAKFVAVFSCCHRPISRILPKK